jgi:hypothetical protein
MNQEKNCRRGFAISLDAIAAISLTLFFFAFLYGYQATSGSANAQFASLSLRQTQLGLLESLEKTGRLAQAVSGNSTAVREVLALTQDGQCFSVSISKFGEFPEVISITKPGCEFLSTQEISKAYRSFAVYDQPYYASLSGWVK